MLIGELARRLRVTTRTLRHYEAIGLLPPGGADPSNGYRHYGNGELVRGMQIEQLKAAGLTLGEIALALGSEAPLAVILKDRRDHLQSDIDSRAAQIAVIDALLAAPAPVPVPRLVTIRDAVVITTTVDTTTDALSACIRRQIQRLRRHLKQRDPTGDWTFAAQFPLDTDGRISLEIAAVVDLRSSQSGTWPGSQAIQVDFVGPHSLLPLAYDAALTAAGTLDLVLTGIVRETYLDLGPAPRTAVAVLVESRVEWRDELSAVLPAGSV